MNRTLALALVLCLGLSNIASAEPEAAPPAAEPAKESHGVGHRLLFWIPNRVFDVLDLVRLRVRVGPGLTVSVRATEALDLNVGAHGTVFVGLHGPRSEPQIPWPLGLETFKAAELSVADAGTDETKHGPQYGPLECGVGFQAAIIGLDVGVEPYDAFDLLAGIFLVDPKGDDF
jgi:hypothetical protein